ncbi:uncharacterized protein [Gossypium hirsutum]|uniref:RNase H type-1 domain-containing protein n=1 Tax=Gossypium hirsutum TaxID=3635 RepID=A0ABM2ZNN2_GOSHI|nr:uncharacterized protein LOC121214571 [Gossypium hirsutum]
MTWVTEYASQNIWSWLTWVFDKGTKEQTRLFCCALWVLWGSRNQMIHEKKAILGLDLSQKIQSYLRELEGSRGSRISYASTEATGQDRDTSREIIQFDAAFDIRNFRSASGIIVRDQDGVIRALKSTLHFNISSPFVAEAYACLEATKLGISMGIDSVTIMGDPKTVIHKCQSTTRDKSVIGMIIHDIQSNRSHFQKIAFRFIQRTENGQAHTLAKDALTKGEEVYLIVPKERQAQNPV